ncbi:MAG TPA: HAMP domain-containing sensor histidine kinase [Geothrix sp.]|nr:HAMP domain-containing sensor histidine kinase [Geothrix sp.]
MGAWILLALLHLGLPQAARAHTWTLSYLLMEILATGSLAYRAWSTPKGGRLAWWLLAASAFLEVPNLVLQFLLLHGRIPAGAEPIISVLTMATGMLVLAGVLSFPRSRERGGTFLRRTLDGLIVAASLLFLLWVMGLQSSLHAAGQGIGLRVLASYLNIALLGGGLVFITSYHPECVRGPLGWLAASACAWLAAISCWTLTGLPSVLVTKDWIILAGAIPLFQGLAAWSPRSVEEALVRMAPERRLVGLLPYVPASFAVLVLGLLLVWAPLPLTRGAFATFLVVVVLLLLRQFLGMEDLQAARRTLEARVLQRTQALERAQDMLLRTERMNSMALMGAGLAHDLNNFLAVIKASTELMSADLEEGISLEQKNLDRISEAADRAVQLTRRLMAFAQREAEPLSPLDLAEVVASLDTTLGMLLPRSISLRVDVQAKAPLMVHSSRLRLEQMVVNLVANARDAMPAGGRLTVKVGPWDATPNMTLLEVIDTGTGMTPEIRERIFEPFFTTKAPGRGTGLGLPSLKAMVEEAGGHLEVESELGRGSRFRLFLPRVELSSAS